MNWYVIYTKPRSEDLVTKRLKDVGINILNPKIILRKFRAGRVVETVEPLFPCYIFAEFDLTRFASMLKYTRGVKYILYKDFPVAVSLDIINALRSRMGEDGCIQLEPRRWKSGDRVFISRGPLNGFYAVFERELNRKNRVMLLLEALNARVEVDSCMIESA